MVVASCLLAAEAWAQVFDFVRSGSFETDANWNPLGPPGLNGQAQFTLDADYTVLFSTSPTNAALAVLDGDVLFRPLFTLSGTNVYTLTNFAIINGDPQTELTVSNHGDRSFELVVEGLLTAGNTQSGRLSIEDGSTVTSEDGTIANFSTSTGQATVRGDGSMWTNSHCLTVGNSGNGSLTIEDGGSISSVAVIVASQPMSTGTAIVSGANSRIAVNASILVGRTGNGTFLIEDGGMASSEFGIIANDAESSGAATVRGNGSTWNSNSQLRVGDAGNGTLTIEDGGSISSASVAIASLSTSTGAATVRGAGSHLNSIGVSVGIEGNGTLNIEEAGLVSSATGTIGILAGSVGQVTVSGAGSTWTNAANLRVGGEGTGTLFVLNGASVSNTTGLIGDLAGSVGQATISGDGSTWTNVGGLFVGGNAFGNGGTGSVAIGNGGIVKVTNVTRLHNDGRITLQGGTLSTDTLDDAGGIFNWSSGTVNLTDPAGFTLGTGDYQFANESLALHAGQSFDVTSALTVPGSGTLSMLGGDLNTGSAEVQAGGRLYLFQGTHDFGAGLMNHSSVIFDSTTINGPVTSPAGSDITVLGDVTFNDLVSGAGGFFGPGTAIFNGGHSPGDSPASVTIEGNLVYGSGSTLTIELGGLLEGEFDQLEILGNATLNGELVVELLDEFTPSIGDQFEILDVDGTLSGQFTGLSEGSLVDTIDTVDLFISYLGGDGNDVVLFADTAGLPGDFDFDSDVDGNDFLAWQRGESPRPLSASELNDWQANYGAIAPPAPISTGVPEPRTLVLAFVAAMWGGTMQRRRYTTLST